MADRFYCPDPPVAGRLCLSGDEARHLAQVLRKQPGDAVELFDGRGVACRAEVVAIGKGLVELAATGELVPDRAASVEVTLATAVPKGERFDWLVEKATELGVARLVPLRTDRSVVDPRSAKLGRLRRAVIEASKQCGRNRLMEIAEPVDLATYLREESSSVRFVAHPGSSGVEDWPEVTGASHAALLIGPEGGFTEGEVEAAKASGCLALGLGPTTLRIETAGLVSVALILVLLGGWRT